MAKQINRMLVAILCIASACVDASNREVAYSRAPPVELPQTSDTEDTAEEVENTDAGIPTEITVVHLSPQEAAQARLYLNSAPAGIDTIEALSRQMPVTGYFPGANNNRDLSVETFCPQLRDVYAISMACRKLTMEASKDGGWQFKKDVPSQLQVICDGARQIGWADCIDSSTWLSCEGLKSSVDGETPLHNCSIWDFSDLRCSKLFADAFGEEGLQAWANAGPLICGRLSSTVD